MRTTPEALDESQPHTSEDEQLALAFDGYLTNWEELRATLLDRGVALRNRSDAELVLRSYQEWGGGCARHLDGEFAFVIVDVRRGEVFAARDHQGLRPLFYHFDSGRLTVASDMAAIVEQLDPKPKPDLDYLAGVMADKWFNPEATPWQDIKRLLPAHSMLFSGDTLSFNEHWSLSTEVNIRYTRDDDYFEHYRELLTDCVRRTSRSHMPLAVSVSGGLDSSALYCLAHELARDGRLPAPSIRGYTLAGEEGTPAYELPYARAAADHVGASLAEVPLTKPALDWYTEQARKTRDIPVPTNGAMSIDLERQAATDGCRALMGGDGGDEWLQGSIHYYREFVIDRDVGGFSNALRQDAAGDGWPSINRIAARQAMGALLPENVRIPLRDFRRRRLRASPDHLYWLNDRFKQRLAELEDTYIASLPSEPIAWSKRNLARSPGADMANTMMQAQYARQGLEPRSPMLTKTFIEFSAATPEHIRSRAGESKFVHRRAMRGTVPDVILERETKADFPSEEMDLHFAKFISEAGAPLLEEICDPDGLVRLIRPDASAQIDDDRSWEVWGVYACAAFLRHHKQ